MCLLCQLSGNAGAPSVFLLLDNYFEIDNHISREWVVAVAVHPGELNQIGHRFTFMCVVSAFPLSFFPSIFVSELPGLLTFKSNVNYQSQASID